MGKCSRSVARLVTFRRLEITGSLTEVPDPRFRTMVEWQEVLPRMERLMQEKGLPPLTDLERETINRYLNRHAKS